MAKQSWSVATIAMRMTLSSMTLRSWLDNQNVVVGSTLHKYHRLWLNGYKSWLARISHRKGAGDKWDHVCTCTQTNYHHYKHQHSSHERRKSSYEYNARRTGEPSKISWKQVLKIDLGLSDDDLPLLLSSKPSSLQMTNPQLSSPLAMSAITNRSLTHCSTLAVEWVRIHDAAREARKIELKLLLKRCDPRIWFCHYSKPLSERFDEIRE